MSHLFNLCGRKYEMHWSAISRIYPKPTLVRQQAVFKMQLRFWVELALSERLSWQQSRASIDWNAWSRGLSRTGLPLRSKRVFRLLASALVTCRGIYQCSPWTQIQDHRVRKQTLNCKVIFKSFQKIRKRLNWPLASFQNKIIMTRPSNH